LLTEKQKSFIDHYLECLNGAEAARMAGYSVRSARQIAHENMQKPEIKSIIDKAFSEQLTKRQAEIDQIFEKRAIGTGRKRRT
jgi:phage terminase small subunit